MTPIPLPLLSETSSQWARAVLCHPEALLNDHAHLEKKAAANALELLCRWPGSEPPEHWLRALTSIAAEEAEHLKIVSEMLLKRGHSLSRNHRNPYAGALHKSIRWGEGVAELCDRLMVAALIEVRSCERFSVLAVEAKDEQPQIAELYAGLLDSEVGHYHAFLRLAGEVAEEDPSQLWEGWLQKEWKALNAAPFFPGILSGPCTWQKPGPSQP